MKIQIFDITLRGFLAQALEGSKHGFQNIGTTEQVQGNSGVQVDGPIGTFGLDIYYCWQPALWEGAE